MGLFQNGTIKVEYLKLMFPDEGVCLNDTILIFDKDGYSSKEFDEIYDWFTNVIKCKNVFKRNHLSLLDDTYDLSHDNIRGLICCIKNSDLQIIESARELYDMYIEGYTGYYICPRSKWEKNK